MASSFTPNRGRLIAFPLREQPKNRGRKPAELNQELSRLRGELRFVEEAIAALERLAAMRLPKQLRGHRQAGGGA